MMMRIVEITNRGERIEKKRGRDYIFFFIKINIKLYNYYLIIYIKVK